MSLTAPPPEMNPTHGARTYELESELLQSCLPRHQKSSGMFMVWLNTLCAIYLGIGILGARNPQLFSFSLPALEEIPVVTESKRDKAEPEKPKSPSDSASNPLPETPADQLPVVVPVAVIDITEAAFAKAVVGLVTLDTKKLGTFDRAAPNVGVVGTVAKPGNPEAVNPPTTAAGGGGGGGGGRRRLTGSDVDYGPPVPQPQVNKHGRVDIDRNAKIWVTFGADGRITDVRIEPPFSHAGYEREVRNHIRNHWKSKVGATSGWAPVTN